LKGVKDKLGGWQARENIRLQKGKRKKKVNVVTMTFAY
jgi:hypothetical protein